MFCCVEFSESQLSGTEGQAEVVCGSCGELGGVPGVGGWVSAAPEYLQTSHGRSGQCRCSSGDEVSEVSGEWTRCQV